MDYTYNGDIFFEMLELLTIPKVPSSNTEDFFSGEWVVDNQATEKVNSPQNLIVAEDILRSWGRNQG